MKLFPRILKFSYYFTIVAAFCANMIVVSHTTTLSVLGAGMALRGPDGSMMTATDALYEERKSVFMIFGVGLACTVGSVVICVWIILSWESAIVCMILTLGTCRTIWFNYQRVQNRFAYDESETVDFTDIMEGPAAIQAVPWKKKGHHKSKKGKHAMNGYHKHHKAPASDDDINHSPEIDRFDMDYQSSQRLIDKNDAVKRRVGKGSVEPSAGRGSFSSAEAPPFSIQTV